MAAELEAQGAFARLVRVDHPFHHPLMRPAAEALEAELADIKPQPGTIPFFSTVTGERCDGESCRRRLLGPRDSRAGTFCFGCGRARGFRRGRMAGTQCASRARAFDAGMPDRHAERKSP